MTGDGVNDILALREADCSIVMAEGDPATRQIANLVLLNSDFNDVPEILFEVVVWSIILPTLLRFS